MIHDPKTLNGNQKHAMALGVEGKPAIIIGKAKNDLGVESIDLVIFQNRNSRGHGNIIT